MDHLENVLLISPLVAILLFICLKYPEVSFSLFIFAGFFKGDPRIAYVNTYIDITLLFVIITLIGLGLNLIINKDEVLKKIRIDPRLLIPYFFLCFMMLLSLNYTGSPIYGLEKLTRFITITTLITFMPYFLFWKEGSIERFLIPIVILATATGAQILIKGFQTSIEEIIQNYIATARMGGIAFIATLFYLLRLRGKPIKKLFYWAAMPLILLTLLAPGGRGPVIAAILSVFLVSIYMFLRLPTVKEHNIDISKVLRTELLITLVIFTIIGFSLIAVSPRLFGRTEMRLTELLVDKSQDLNYIGRMDRYKTALDSMYAFPTVLFGLGVGGFNEAYGGMDSLRGDYPHNIFLEVGSELGLLSLIALLYLIIRSVKLALLNIKTAKTRDNFYLSMTVLILLTYMIINSSVSGDINENRLLFAIIGIIFALRNKAVVERLGEHE